MSPPSTQMIEAAAKYLAGASRSKQAWDGSFRKYDEGGLLTGRELVELHGAALGLVWTTHTTDLPSALAVLQQVEAAVSPESAAFARESSALVPDRHGPDHFREQAARVLELRPANSYRESPEPS